MGKATVHLELFDDQTVIYDEEREKLKLTRAAFADLMFREWFSKRKIDYPTKYGRDHRKEKS